jgi:hypothetical protein
MDKQSLQEQNESFNGTMAVSGENRDLGFSPAFRDEETGQIELAKLADGRLAPMHRIACLPTNWATSFDEDGDVASVKRSITAGFVRGGKFFTREEACAVCASDHPNSTHPNSK